MKNEAQLNVEERVFPSFNSAGISFTANLQQVVTPSRKLEGGAKKFDFGNLYTQQSLESENQKLAMMRLKDMRYLRSDVVKTQLKILDQEDAEFDKDESRRSLCEEGNLKKPLVPGHFKKPSSKLENPLLKKNQKLPQKFYY